MDKPCESIVATFSEYDIEWMLECDEKVLEYIKENDMMEEVVKRGADFMVHWYDGCCGDVVYEAAQYALKEVVGESKLSELREGENG